MPIQLVYDLVKVRTMRMPSHENPAVRWIPRHVSAGVQRARAGNTAGKPGTRRRDAGPEASGWATAPCSRRSRRAAAQDPHPGVLADRVVSLLIDARVRRYSSHSGLLEMPGCPKQRKRKAGRHAVGVAFVLKADQPDA